MVMLQTFGLGAFERLRLGAGDGGDGGGRGFSLQDACARVRAHGEILHG
jgi:hypothetical protein